jgi:hypothetical protein
LFGLKEEVNCGCVGNTGKVIPWRISLMESYWARNDEIKFKFKMSLWLLCGQTRDKQEMKQENVSGS